VEVTQLPDAVRFWSPRKHWPRCDVWFENFDNPDGVDWGWIQLRCAPIARVVICRSRCLEVLLDLVKGQATTVTEESVAQSITVQAFCPSRSCRGRDV